MISSAHDCGSAWNLINTMSNQAVKLKDDAQKRLQRCWLEIHAWVATHILGCAGAQQWQAGEEGPSGRGAAGFRNPFTNGGRFWGGGARRAPDQGLWGRKASEQSRTQNGCSSRLPFPQKG